MKSKHVAIALCIGLLLSATAYRVGSANPLSEDTNGNTMPDVIELQHGTFKVFTALSVGPIVTVTTLTIAVIVAYHNHAIQRKDMDYRDKRDISLKIYRSKYRGVIVTKFWALAVLCLVLGGLILVSAQKITNNPLSEDQDGDGLPTIVENQVGTNPNDPYDYVALPSLNMIVVEPLPLNVTIGR
ncbi:thrombospondin type 3 repeat-containing protein [Archaeoglobus sp.]